MTTTKFIRATAVAMFACSAAACGGSTTEDAAPALVQPANDIGVVQAPTLLAAVPEEATAIAVSGTRVFFTARKSMLGGVMTNNGSLYSIWKSGGSADMLAVDKFGSSFANLVIADRQLLWSTSDGRILAVDERGGDLRVVADRLGSIANLVADAAAVYVGAAPEGGSAGVYRIDLRSGERTLLVAQAGVSAIAQSGNEVYYADKSAGLVGAIDKASRAQRVVARDQAGVCGLGVAGVSVVWTNTGDLQGSATGSVRRSLAGAQSIIAAKQVAPCAVATDGVSIFWAPAQNAPVEAKFMRASLVGESVTALGAMKPAQDLGAVAVDERHVFWLTRDGVYRARK